MGDSEKMGGVLASSLHFRIELARDSLVLRCWKLKQPLCQHLLEPHVSHPSLMSGITFTEISVVARFGWRWFHARVLWVLCGLLWTTGHDHCIYSYQPGLCVFFLLNFSFQRHYNDEDPEKEKRIKELELLLMSTENELKGQQALPVSCHCVLDPSGG